MAESEASGEARVDDPVEDPIDTDPFAVRAPDAGVEPAAAGEFEHLLDEPVEATHESQPAAADPEDGAFDAFNETTWNFKPAPIPWHRTRQAVVAMVAVVIAVIALVVSVVLLTVHGPANEENVPATETSAVPTTETTPATTSAVPPLLPPPPPPPPPPAASEIQQAPVYAPAPRSTKKPEINVTRKPMSVSPQKPSGR